MVKSLKILLKNQESFKAESLYIASGTQDLPSLFKWWGWLGEARVSRILCHRGVQLILAYSWARLAILAAGKDRGGMFLFLLFLHCHSFSFFPCLSLPSLLLSFFSLSLGDNTK